MVHDGGLAEGGGLWDRKLGKTEDCVPLGPLTRVTAGPVSDRLALRKDSPVRRLAGLWRGCEVSKRAVCFHFISQPLGSGMWVLQVSQCPEVVPEKQG